MSGRINYSNLSDSLKEQLNGLGLTEEQVNELIENALVDKVGELNGLMTEEKGDLVGAINELFQSANNGKELIANAIGEPVSADDTFSAMSNDINSLLSTFKTNMMNNGVIVESGDKFKSLIEKIKGLTEGGGNKGIQFISGTLGSSNYVSRNMTQTSGNVNSVGCFKIPMPNFEPVLIYAEGRITSQACDSPTIYLNLGRSGGYSFSYRKASNVYYTTCYFYKMDRDSEFLYLQTEGISSSDTFDYYIIGVGEDDTTLLDSLKSILAEEGVTTTEEDDMASLISKVDTEFNEKNTEISSLNTNITLLTNQVNNLTSELAGKVTPAGNAVAANVLSGKTFINSTGQTITGTMANNGTKTITPKASAQTLGAGYYDEITINGDVDLVAANIVSGKNIFGVAGTATVSSLGGKQFATGTSSTFDNSTTWTYYNGTKAEGVYTLSVTGLSFTPSTVIAYGDLGTPYGYVFSCLHSDFAIYMPKIRASYNSNWNVAQGLRYKKIQVTNGFKLPIERGSGTLTWVAFA